MIKKFSALYNANKLNRLSSDDRHGVQRQLDNQPPLISLYFIMICSLLIRVIYMEQANLMVEETYYWNYAQHMDFSFLDHPPMVAVLIKLFTLIFGNHEFTVRIASLFCWFVTAFFSFKLTDLIHKGSGIYALTLLAVLPFFFSQSIVITPDGPLIACWSASLYYLYRCLVLNEKSYWYGVGIWLGLGMLSKYTISLLGIATLSYVLIVPIARSWFTKKEPYLAVLMTTILFTPVIYWNATHEWVSFIFQSNRRWSAVTSMDLHYVLALILLFITPVGVWGFITLFKRKTTARTGINNTTKRFMQIFTLIPLGFFSLFSLNHEINFNWIGPLFLALIPWLAILMSYFCLNRSLWLKSGVGLLLVYLGVLLIINYNTSEAIQRKFFVKVIAWSNLIKQFNDVAQHL
ncbi:MAG: glycosyltransferase family 39 protein, partial [bacterium]|nr:glycosyltransferase family 39 protein [bacterium]